MNDHPDLKPVLDFLSGLQKNNNKPWFEEHRPAYENARDQFEAFVDQLIAGFGPLEDLGGLTSGRFLERGSEIIGILKGMLLRQVAAS